jgi:hypothetical protein
MLMMRPQAPFVLAHAGHPFTTQVVRAVQVDGHDLAPLLRVGLGQLVVREHAGIVDQNVDTADLLAHIRAGGLDLCGITQIEQNGKRALAEGGRHRFQSCAIRVGQHHRVALCQQRARNGRSHRAADARHHRDALRVH